MPLRIIVTQCTAKLFIAIAIHGANGGWAETTIFRDVGNATQISTVISSKSAKKSNADGVLGVSSARQMPDSREIQQAGFATKYFNGRQ